MQIVWFYYFIVVFHRPFIICCGCDCSTCTLHSVSNVVCCVSYEWLLFAVCRCHAINFWRNRKQLNFQVYQTIRIKSRFSVGISSSHRENERTQNLLMLLIFFYESFGFCAGGTLMNCHFTNANRLYHVANAAAAAIVVAMQWCFRWTMCVRD